MLALWKRVDGVCLEWRERFACSDPACPGARRFAKRLSGRRGGNIRLHNEKYCFPHCFAPALERRFAQMLTANASTQRPAHRIPLGLLLLARGEIDESQLRAALAAQQSNGVGRIGEWIEHMGFAAGTQILTALGAQWACPVLPEVPTAQFEGLIPLALMRRFRMAPVHYSPPAKTLCIGFSEGIEYGAMLGIEQVLECAAQPCIIGSAALDRILARSEDTRRRAEHFFDSVKNSEEMLGITLSYAAALSAQQARMARCGEFLWVRLLARADSVDLLFPAQG